MIILVMGVSGSGKTTIGRYLAADLGWQFRDADDFHPPGNIEKMRQGIPLTDSDRAPWLLAMQQAIRSWIQTNTNVVLACSALKSSYRQILYQPTDPIQLVYLTGSFELIQQRLNQRQGHYMQANLLKSQFDALEQPENALIVDITQSPPVIIEQIRTALGLIQ
ncbi:gluconokinase [Kovacikia minuta CCNUW1]|uniref:gluconokinase n=1 Tax=Kovacikia minuta TaxID=2931930 RepID=UPI001CCA3652|nr:gluconokinase [Kovacikia minuta]UBF24958.1 gluconokinase [Kovacikia minuta CCNUW1]